MDREQLIKQLKVEMKTHIKEVRTPDGTVLFSDQANLHLDDMAKATTRYRYVDARSTNFDHEIEAFAAGFDAGRRTG